MVGQTFSSGGRKGNTNPSSQTNNNQGNSGVENNTGTTISKLKEKIEEEPPEPPDGPSRPPRPMKAVWPPESRHNPKPDNSEPRMDSERHSGNKVIQTSSIQVKVKGDKVDKEIRDGEKEEQEPKKEEAKYEESKQTRNNKTQGKKKTSGGGFCCCRGKKTQNNAKKKQKNIGNIPTSEKNEKQLVEHKNIIQSERIPSEANNNPSEINEEEKFPKIEEERGGGTTVKDPPGKEEPGIIVLKEERNIMEEDPFLSSSSLGGSSAKNGIDQPLLDNSQVKKKPEEIAPQSASKILSAESFPEKVASNTMDNNQGKEENSPEQERVHTAEHLENIKEEHKEGNMEENKNTQNDIS